LEILSIIPARGGSKGIPMKNLVKLKHKPLLYYSIKASLNLKHIAKTVVTTDNERIARYAKKLSAQVVIRPKRLANDKARLEPTIEHTLDFLKKNENYIPNVVLLLQNTSPLRTSKHIDDAIRLFITKKFDSVFSAYPSHYFLWKLKNKKAHPVNYNPFKRPNRQEIITEFVENGAIYITKYDSFKKSRCRISGKIGIYPMPPELSLEVDTKDDLEIIKSIMNRIKH